MAKPPPTATIRKLIGKQSETAADASALNWPTQNVSVS